MKTANSHRTDFISALLAEWTSPLVSGEINPANSTQNNNRRSSLRSLVAKWPTDWMLVSYEILSFDGAYLANAVDRRRRRLVENESAISLDPTNARTAGNWLEITPIWLGRRWLSNWPITLSLCADARFQMAEWFMAGCQAAAGSASSPPSKFSPRAVINRSQLRRVRFGKRNWRVMNLIPRPDASGPFIGDDWFNCSSISNVIKCGDGLRYHRAVV